MQKNQSHIEKRLEEKLSMLPELNLDYSKSKDEVWAGLSSSIEHSAKDSTAKMIAIHPRRVWLAAAAVIILLLGIAAFMHLYTAVVVAPAGRHATAKLPDGSTVELNAESQIQYQPYWWFLDREVKLQGEAFFEVKQGETFRVISPGGTTSVLGTSFNVYARNHEYQVTCYSGNVMVVASETGHSLSIASDEQATLTKEGGLRLSVLKNREEVVSWKNNMFMFTSTPLRKVLDEIERQYDVEIETAEMPVFLYSGNFPRSESLDQVLELVCRPFGLTCRQEEGRYLILND